MPIIRTKGGGYKWGKSGKVYYGKGAKDKARKQGIAITLNRGKRGSK